MRLSALNLPALARAKIVGVVTPFGFSNQIEPFLPLFLLHDRPIRVIFAHGRLGAYNPRAHALPIPDHDKYEVDYRLDAGPRPLFLFGVKDSDKARLVTISCLEFQRRGLRFKSVMVHQNFESGIARKDRIRITSAADKQFTSLDDFRETGPRFFEHERVA
jgi:hypothetical protein